MTTTAIDALVAEHADLERQLADPALHADAAAARKVGRRFSQLAPIVGTYRKLESARGDLAAARERLRLRTEHRRRPRIRRQRGEGLSHRSISDHRRRGPEDRSGAGAGRSAHQRPFGCHGASHLGRSRTPV